jgi:hypothetical protein
MPSTGVVLVIIVLIILANHILFQGMGRNYLEWYIRNGTLIGLITAMFAIVWDQLDRNVAMISAHPRAYVAGCLMLVALPLITLGHQIDQVGQRLSRSSSGPLPSSSVSLLLNVLVMLPVLLVLLGLFAAWFVFIVPLQYFVFIVCGALPRSLLQSPLRVIARTEGFGFETRLVATEEPVPTGWWDASFTRKPVAMTAALSSLLLLGVRALLQV